MHTFPRNKICGTRAQALLACEFHTNREILRAPNASCRALIHGFDICFARVPSGRYYTVCPIFRIVRGGRWSRLSAAEAKRSGSGHQLAIPSGHANCLVIQMSISEVASVFSRFNRLKSNPRTAASSARRQRHVRRTGGLDRMKNMEVAASIRLNDAGTCA